jgi:hypothetical protein
MKRLKKKVFLIDQQKKKSHHQQTPKEERERLREIGNVERDYNFRIC